MMNFLNNASIASLIGGIIGAVGAFLVVMITDRFRGEKDKESLRILVDNNRNHAKKKIRTVQMNLAMLTKEHRVTGATIMRFPTRLINEYQFKVLNLMEDNEAQALDALVYWMESIDDLLDEATDHAKELKSLSKQERFGLLAEPNVAEPKKTLANDECIECFEDAERNLNHLVELAGYYVNGEFNKILGFAHPIRKDR